MIRKALNQIKVMNYTIEKTLKPSNEAQVEKNNIAEAKPMAQAFQIDLNHIELEPILEKQEAMLEKKLTLSRKRGSSY